PSTPGALPSATAAAVVPVAAAAAYYLVLRSAPIGTGRKTTRVANPRVPYKLVAAVESGPEDLEQEPNDEPGRATDIASGGSRTGYLSPPGDVDWYRVHSDQPMILHVEVSPLERADLELSVLAAGIHGWIWPRRDVDVFRFYIPPGAAPVTIRLSPVRGVDLALRLLELRGARADVIGTADAVRGEGEEQMVAVPLKEGDYAVE